MKTRFILSVSAIVSLLCLLGIMGFVAQSTYDNSRSNVIEIGRLAAEENAEKINLFFTRQFDVMQTVTESVDYLRSELSATNDDTRAYLTSVARSYEPLYETYADDAFIGIYGVFDGEYIDSTWTPPEGFEPTSRAWYKAALDAGGEVCVTQPYADADDGDYIVSLSRMLSDGSVMGMDVDVRHIRHTVGAAMGLTLNVNGNETVSGLSFAMTEGGIVTMHRDDEEVAQNYSDPESPMHEVFERVTSGEPYFELEVDREKFAAFATKLDDGWYYVTLLNLDDLHATFVKFVRVIVWGTAYVLLFAMVYCFAINRVNRRAERLAGSLAQALEDIKVDRLTKLYNRVAYDQRLDGLKGALGTPEDVPFALVMMDINNLKFVNDHLGHQKGDTYILTCCNKMKEIFGDNIYRLGGDEFAVILTDEQYERREPLCEAMAQCGMDALQRPISENNANIAVGMACHEAGVAESIAAIVNRADAAMYRNKEALKKARGMVA